MKVRNRQKSEKLQIQPVQPARETESQDQAERRKAADRESKASKRDCESQDQAER